jgi:YggT family protein
MNATPIVNALVFLINVSFGSYILLLLLRVLLYWTRAGFREVSTAFVWRITDSVVRPAYRWLPIRKNIDFAALVLMYLLEVLRLSLTFWLYGKGLSVIGLLLLAGLELITLLIYTFTITLMLAAVFSFITPQHTYNPLVPILNRINEPLLRIARRVPYYLQGIDFSPMIVLIILQLISILLIEPLSHLAVRL